MIFLDFWPLFWPHLALSECTAIIGAQVWGLTIKNPPLASGFHCTVVTYKLYLLTAPQHSKLETDLSTYESDAQCFALLPSPANGWQMCTFNIDLSLCSSSLAMHVCTVENTGQRLRSTERCICVRLSICWCNWGMPKDICTSRVYYLRSEKKSSITRRDNKLHEFACWQSSLGRFWNTKCKKE